MPVENNKYKAGLRAITVVTIVVALLCLSAAKTYAENVTKPATAEVYWLLQVDTQQSVEQTAAVIRSRIALLGITDAGVELIDDRIAVNLKGVQDVARLKKVLTTPAKLEFKISDADFDDDARLASLDIDSDHDVVYGDPSDAFGALVYVVRKTPVLTGAHITDAEIKDMQPYANYGIAIRFSAEGARLFEDITKQCVGLKLAIILDGKVISAPIVAEKIGGGQAVISGEFTMAEAQDLALALRAGYLPAQVTVLQERIID